MTSKQGSFLDSETTTRTFEPGEYLRRRLAMQGISVTDLADEIEVHSQTLYAITAGRRGISAKLAMKLANYFGDDPETWMSDKITVDVSAASFTPSRTRRTGGNDKRAEEIESPIFSRLSGHNYGVLVDGEIEAAVASDEVELKVEPFDRDQIQPASLDLTIGLIITHGYHALTDEQWWIIMKDLLEEPLTEEEVARLPSLRKKAEDAEAKYELESSFDKLSSGHIIARERVKFGNVFFADVGSVTTNARKGLLVNHGFQIDPGYRGPIAVSFIKISEGTETVGHGQKLVSLAIHKLHREPDAAYQRGIDRKVYYIGRKLRKRLIKSFKYKKIGSDRIKVILKRPEKTLIAEGEEEAHHKAIQTLLDLLPEGSRTTRDPDVLNEVLDRMDEVLVRANEVEALARMLKMRTNDRRIKEAARHFTEPTDEQTLRDTLKRLGANIPQALHGLLQNEH